MSTAAALQVAQAERWRRARARLAPWDGAAREMFPETAPETAWVGGAP